MLKSKIQFIIIIYFFFLTSYSQEYNINGKLSTWCVVPHEEFNITQTGIRYIPYLDVIHYFPSGGNLNVHLSVNSYYNIQNFNPYQDKFDIKNYRSWIRYATNQLEIRAGLQKINFGPSVLIRPLMWFDKINPGDPLKLTDGVYGIIGRYYFLNNANIWFWTLLGNRGTKGFETFPTAQNKPEFGGRFQYPVYTGEMALTVHHRITDTQSLAVPDLQNIAENRIGFDARIDAFFGLWFETALIHQDINIPYAKYQRLVNLGADYTFDIGNGIRAVAEFFRATGANKIFGHGRNAHFYASSLNYPVGMLDQLNFMVFYNDESDEWYHFAQFQRLYDNWSIYFIYFRNPEKFDVFLKRQGSSVFAGNGFQFMIVFNH